MRARPGSGALPLTQAVLAGIEIPLQTACALLTRLRAAQHACAAPLHRFMNKNHPAKPRMPGIKNFPFLGLVGVILSSCTMKLARTYH
jgi:hypothetical protein